MGALPRSHGLVRGFFHPCVSRGSLRPFPFTMIAPETFSHLENIKKRAGYLWRFL